MRTLSLSLFHRFFKIGVYIRLWLNAHLISSADGICFRYLVLTIAAVNKPVSQRQVVGKGKITFVACRHRSEIFGCID